MSHRVAKRVRACPGLQGLTGVAPEMIHQGGVGRNNLALLKPLTEALEDQAALQGGEQRGASPPPEGAPVGE